MPRRSGPARWPLILLAVAFAVLGVLVVVQSDGGDDTPTPDGDGTATVTTVAVPTEAVPGDPDPIEVSRSSYRITYRVEGFATDGGAVIDTERRWVRAPYESRVETIPGEDGDDPPTFLQIAGFGFLQTGRETEEPAVLAVEPGVAPGDARIDVSGLEWRHEARTVLDRRCQVFRAGSTIDVATVAAPTDDTWADLCVDETGLLLYEEWVISGELFRRRIAAELDPRPTLDDELFEPSGVRSEGASGGVLAEVTPESQPADTAYYELGTPPTGFEHRGRFGYSPPRAEMDQAGGIPTAVALLLDVYERGDGEILVVANGGTSDRTASVRLRDGSETVDLGGIGTGAIVRGLRQHEVRVGFERGRFLRVWGTLPVDDLVALTRALQATTDPNGQVTAK